MNSSFSFFALLVIVECQLLISLIVINTLYFVWGSTKIYKIKPHWKKTKKTDIFVQGDNNRLSSKDESKNSIFPKDESNITDFIFFRLARVVTNQFVRSIASNSRLGKVVFNTPETMYFGNSKVIELKITDNLLEKIKIEGEGKIETENIDIYTSMKVELTGTGFDIKLLAEKSQIILKDKIVTWRWLVIPNKLGKQKLYLNVYAIFQIGNDKQPLNLNTFERVIKVRVNPRLTLIKNWLRLLLWIIPGGAITTFISKRIIDYLKHKDWIKLPF